MAAFLAEAFRVEPALLANFIAIGSQPASSKATGKSGRFPMSVGGSFKNQQLPPEFRVAVLSWMACELLNEALYRSPNADRLRELLEKSPDRFERLVKALLPAKAADTLKESDAMKAFLEGWGGS